MLGAIHQDLLSSRTELDDLERVTSAQLATFDVFATSGSSEFVELLPDSATVILRALFPIRTYQPFDGTLRVADLSVVRDDNLRAQLGRWIGLSQDLLENSPYLFDYRTRVAEAAGFDAYAGRLADPSGAKVAELLSDLRDDDSFMLAATMFRDLKRNTLAKAAILSVATDELLLQLREEG